MAFDYSNHSTGDANKITNHSGGRLSKAETIRTYLNDPNRRALISVTALEKRAGLPASTLNKFLRSERDFPERHMDKLIQQLEYIGFKE